MRQVFTSPRLANVEAVAQMLEDAGIATRITNDRSYRGNFDRGISYRARPGGDSEQAAVWVVRSEDQPRARAMLRDAGLLDSTRPDQQRESLLPDHLRGTQSAASAKRGFSPARLKVALLIAIAVVMAMAAFWQRREGSDPVAPPARAPTAAPSSGDTGAKATQGLLETRTAAPVVQRIDVPSALAAMLAARSARAHGFSETCLQVDGGPPVERIIEALSKRSDVPTLIAEQTCNDSTAAARVSIDLYRTDGSGVGTVRLTTTVGGRAHEERLQVERIGFDWSVIGPAPP